MIIIKSCLLCLLKYLVNKTGAKNTIQSKKYNIYMRTKKNTAAMTTTPKITDFRNWKPKKYSADPYLYIYQVHPLG